MLNEDGTLYTANLRGAPQMDRYTLRGTAARDLRAALHLPRFPLRGADRPAAAALAGRADRPRLPFRGARGRAASSAPIPLLNQLMAEHPLDPARQPDEYARPIARSATSAWAGWATSRPSLKPPCSTWTWPRSSPSGSRTCATPRPTTAGSPISRRIPCDPNERFSGVPAWGDAGVIVPWRVYQNYADTRLLAEHFESARRWVDCIRAPEPGPDLAPTAAATTTTTG